MKKFIQILILLFIIIVPISCSLSAKEKPSFTEQSVQKTVYVCDGKYATKFHKNSSCRGLSNCKGYILEMYVSDAKQLGRTPCSICY